MGNESIAAIVVSSFLIVVVLWYITMRNRFENLAVKIAESDSGIDIALTRRYNALTKMLDVAKGYAKHEAELLGAIVRLRKGMNIVEKQAANEQMDELSGKISVVAEDYPELKANESYKQLQLAVADVEDNLQAARRIYNMNVSLFNQLLASLPAGLIGKARGHAPKAFFEAEEYKKQDVKMAF